MVLSVTVYVETREVCRRTAQFPPSHDITVALAAMTILYSLWQQRPASSPRNYPHARDAVQGAGKPVEAGRGLA